MGENFCFTVNGVELSLIHILTGRSVVTTVCNGKVLMKNRELVGLDEEKILYEVREEAKKLAHSING